MARFICSTSFSGVMPARHSSSGLSMIVVSIMDSGAAGTMCPKAYAEKVANTIVTGTERVFRTASGERNKALGHRFVESEATTSSGRTAHVGSRSCYDSI